MQSVGLRVSGEAWLGLRFRTLSPKPLILFGSQGAWHERLMAWVSITKDFEAGGFRAYGRYTLLRKVTILDLGFRV